MKFPFIISAMDANIQLKFGVYIQHKNIQVSLSQFSSIIFDRVVPLGLGKSFSSSSSLYMDILNWNMNTLLEYAGQVIKWVHLDNDMGLVR